MLKGLLRNLLIATGVVGGSGILYLLLLDSVIMPRIVDVSRVTVPNVGNRTVPEAQRLIKQMGLRLTLRDSVYSDAPVGHVIDQELVDDELFVGGESRGHFPIEFFMAR